MRALLLAMLGFLLVGHGSCQRRAVGKPANPNLNDNGNGGNGDGKPPGRPPFRKTTTTMAPEKCEVPEPSLPQLLAQSVMDEVSSQDSIMVSAKWCQGQFCDPPDIDYIENGKVAAFPDVPWPESCTDPDPSQQKICKSLGGIQGPWKPAELNYCFNDILKAQRGIAKNPKADDCGKCRFFIQRYKRQSSPVIKLLMHIAPNEPIHNLVCGCYEPADWIK